jgi:hypothetical protein
MAKAAKKRAGKKRKMKKSAGKKVRARKAAPKKAAPKVKRKVSKAKRSKPKAAKRKPAHKASAMMVTPRRAEAWPMVFAVVVALLAGIAVMWHFGGISIAAAASLPMQMPIAPVAGLVYAGCDMIAAADTWLALAHPALLPLPN